MIIEYAVTERASAGTGVTVVAPCNACVILAMFDQESADQMFLRSYHVTLSAWAGGRGESVLLAFPIMPRVWYVPREERNRLAHIANGNTSAVAGHIQNMPLTVIDHIMVALGMTNCRGRLE